jgi:hypothetical protein
MRGTGGNHFPAVRAQTRSKSLLASEAAPSTPEAPQDLIRRNARQDSAEVVELAIDVCDHRACLVAPASARVPALLDNEQAPFTGHALEVVCAAIDELEVGAGDQVLDGAGDQYLIRRGGRCDAGPDMHRDTADIVAD